MDSVVEQNHATESNLFITFALAISKQRTSMKLGIVFIAVGLLFVITGSIIVAAKKNEKPEKKKVTFEDVAAQMDKTPETKGQTPSLTPEPPEDSPEPPEPTGQESKDITSRSQNPESDNGHLKMENVPPTPKQKGNDFEGMMADILKASGLRLLEWNQGTTSPGGAYAENELKPDFLVHQNARGMELRYWVECKYRSSLPANGFYLKDYQSERYQKIQKESKRKVVVVLGVGGRPDSPDKFYVIPLDTITRFKRVGHKFLPHYNLESPRTNFAGHMSSWFFNEVFKKANKY